MTETEVLNALQTIMIPICSRLDGIETRLDTMQLDIDTMKVDMANMKIDMINMKDDMANMKDDMANMKDDMANMKDDIDKINYSNRREHQKTQRHLRRIDDQIETIIAVLTLKEILPVS